MCGFTEGKASSHRSVPLWGASRLHPCHFVQLGDSEKLKASIQDLREKTDILKERGADTALVVRLFDDLSDTQRTMEMKDYPRVQGLIQDGVTIEGKLTLELREREKKQRQG